MALQQLQLKLGEKSPFILENTAEFVPTIS